MAIKARDKLAQKRSIKGYAANFTNILPPLSLLAFH